MEKAAAGAGVPLIRPLWGMSGPDLLQVRTLENMIEIMLKNSLCVWGGTHFVSGGDLLQVRTC